MRDSQGEIELGDPPTPMMDDDDELAAEEKEELESENTQT